MAVFSENRKAYHDYEILETFEAGLVLTGPEVKSTKGGRMSIAGSYVTFHNGEAYLIGASISPYQPKNQPADYDPARSRKLLLHKEEIASLLGKIQQKGLTLVPIKVYNKGRRIKLEFALARGKKQYDRRADIAKKEAKRKIGRALRKEI
ncbi:SsrA-binding protein [Candidatus Azambacteria bacterium RIFCSPHIGHO2_01_FULL_44_55]|uniref:SsrA-binding protein n=1 Tax=Candidatus Azambacteria bacterium RIFCSPLOWO2_02_FULL_44_14 TaxID=1797306 RepID=A0A1F5CAC3_9BACT|nr:MAG: SsrA-binding protein [Candidatus Azambacteria bacterium RIFCSPLOWO2_01_FULL_44_84]OGD32827.1 MAG: SsrA-binding protein [Candidatus Azambacteria bacterium RIFCSPHIGHO2_02_FULL_45_18]OGD39793.1 MAG: SsrA-binding protein [Candidatus Azambacteria bacterium RIFCSPLOWO2_02_FULL_44_14]OGD41627.1 MAG: SsrA-binding protein [Candidatus Azambacteria bacterium RIFCSPHIGHO2_01_FULL_44_55]OGD52111.1 MAG: SsrA-binding protein [Candidatus Azambacteria bacterium RIFOXYD1_FULL_44_10]